MAGRIAGITIEIGGDTKNLQKSLKGVDSELKKTQSNLKDVNKLLKLDPKNTELLVIYILELSSLYKQPAASKICFTGTITLPLCITDGISQDISLLLYKTL